MYDSIKKLWCGKMHPWEKHIVDIDKITALCKSLDSLEEKIKTQLDEKGQALFKDLITGYSNLIECLEADSFIKGFRLGGDLTMEILK